VVILIPRIYRMKIIKIGRADLEGIFVLNQEEVFGSIISPLEFEQIPGYTPEGS